MKSNYQRNTKTSSGTGGIGCLTVLGLIFITLKLTGNINWSWPWVLSPFIAQGIAITICLLVMGLIMGLSRRG